MSYQRVNWKNYPNRDTPLGERNLNNMDYALYQQDERITDVENNRAYQSDMVSATQRITTLETVKANQSDLLLGLKTLSYNVSTGVFIFTHFNGSTQTIDLNIEKIPVSFTLSDTGILTMITEDGTQYTADLSRVIKIYEYLDSDTIHISLSEGNDGVLIVTASIIDGSITADKLQPNYLSDITYQAEIASDAADSASEAADSASDDSVLARSYAVGGTGTRPGEDTDNARYYKEQAKAIVDAKGHTIIDSLGNVFPDRGSLQFENGQITDDPTNDITKVAVSMIITDADWTQIEQLLIYMDNPATFDLFIPDEDWSEVETILV